MLALTLEPITSPTLGTKEHFASKLLLYCDFRYRQYEENLSCSSGFAPSTVKLAIFGLGRAGTIHLSNIIANPRVQVTHIVEVDTTKWEPVKNKWNLATTKFVHPDKAAEVNI